MYNSDYWAVMGSASPTILLAAIIALGGVFPVRRERSRRSRSSVPIVIGYGAMIPQVAVFWFSLYSLGVRQDAVPTAVATGLEIGATLLFIAASGIAAGVQNHDDGQEKSANKMTEGLALQSGRPAVMPGRKLAVACRRQYGPGNRQGAR